VPSVAFLEKPGCINNTKQKAWLRERGVKVDAIDLLTYDWSKEKLLGFFGEMPVSEWFNYSAPRIKSGEVVPEQLTPEQALQAMLEEPLLIRRPLLQKGEERRVGFEEEAIALWLDIPLGHSTRKIGETCPQPTRPCTTGEVGR